MAYLLDADVFIRAKNLHYGLDFCPAFWEWLIEQNRARQVFSIEKVGDEVQAVADELSLWAKAQYEPAAVSTFLQVADYYLVAHALAYRYTVVTHEVPAASTRKIKIPDACIGIRIKCMTPFEMLRRERARFILGRQ